MVREVSRQLVHLSGVLFVVLAQFIGGFIVSFYLLLAALTFFVYSYYFYLQQKRINNLFSKMRDRLVSLALKFERLPTERPFLGAFWFFFSLGISFLIFPLPIASAAGIILSVGDGLSTLVGKHLGRHKIYKNKTWEGTITCFLGSLLAVFFVSPLLAVTGAIVAAIVEIFPNKKFGSWEVNDNFFIPIVSGLFMLGLSLYL